MEESLKKLVYAGVGFAAQASEKFEKSIEELVKKGNIEEKEGKKIVNDFFAKSEKTKESFESKFKKTTEEIVTKFKLAPQSEVTALNKRIEKLEKWSHPDRQKQFNKVISTKKYPRQNSPIYIIRESCLIFSHEVVRRFA